MKIVSFKLGSEHRVGVELEAGLFDFSCACQACEREVSGRQWRMIRDIETLIRLARFDAAAFDSVFEWATVEGRFEEFLVDRPVLDAPLRSPGKIVALARNYGDHARETGCDVPTEPVLFAKNPSAIIGPNAAIKIPKEMGRVDPEVELAVVIGESVRNCRREDAMRAVAGYTIINDVTARDLQTSLKDRGLPWHLSKNLDTFCPLGPCVVLAEAVPDPQDIAMELYVNNELRQSDNTASMVFDIPALITYISRYMTLEPGDIIATGTPAGIAPINPGDLVKCRLAGIGELINPVA